MSHLPERKSWHPGQHLQHGRDGRRELDIPEEKFLIGWHFWWRLLSAWQQGNHGGTQKKLSPSSDKKRGITDERHGTLTEHSGAKKKTIQTGTSWTAQTAERAD